MATQDERRIALEILKKVRALDLPLKLDEITEGRGNCFPLSVIQQCSRPEIFRQLNQLTQNIIQRNNPTLLREAVHNFMAKSTNPKMQAFFSIQHHHLCLWPFSWSYIPVFSRQ